MNIFKTERPIIALILGILLVFKVISALEFLLLAMFQPPGLVVPVVGLEMMLIAFAAYTLNTRGGGQSSLLKTAFSLTIVIALDSIIIYSSLNEASLPSSTAHKVVGVELTYILTIAYIFFSKKLRRFKETDV
ncbi:hypothetical protein ACUTEI_001400 [Cronobacter sakazakii]